MLRVLAYFLVNTLIISFLSWLLGDFNVNDLFSGFIFVVVLTILNWTIIPIIKFFAFPFNFLTLGLVNGIINLLAIGLADYLSPGVEITGGFFGNLVTSIIIAIGLSIGSSIVQKLTQDEE